MGNCQSTPEFHCFSLCTRLLHANSEIDAVTSLAPSSVSRSSNTTVFYQIGVQQKELHSLSSYFQLIPTGTIFSLFPTFCFHLTFASLKLGNLVKREEKLIKETSMEILCFLSQPGRSSAQWA
ncbi:hypothetical protein K7X08_037315 [Anisodus acutangulus]|uniref:Uncharacterized protein n=1 Tax=Anisodus acutangulus TaxID=402998 RepID=A0A9Q1RSG5_9SOLA|nr:hypothetical protein K7X08_037315 [Anisodus acutangulus]